MVNTNVAAGVSGRNVGKSSRTLSLSNAKLASGSRITTAADDAAGLAVAENLQAASRSTRMAMRNLNDGASLLNVAEGATSQTGDILIRMRELAVQSSSEVLSQTERAYLAEEYTELIGEIDRMSNVTSFNGKQLVDGNNPTISIQVGINNSASDRVDIVMGDISVLTLGVHTSTTKIGSVSTAQAAIEQIDQALDTVNGYMSDYGAISNKLGHAMNYLEIYSENLGSSETQIRDVDMAHESAYQARSQILNQASLSVLAQAKQIGQGALGLI
ncbi:MAG: flagellin [Myxococcota bacterium]|nr:flagellin [Myxococcota bacterium]